MIRPVEAVALLKAGALHRAIFDSARFTGEVRRATSGRTSSSGAAP